jgi:hypothetical protein
MAVGAAVIALTRLDVAMKESGATITDLAQAGDCWAIRYAMGNAELGRTDEDVAALEKLHEECLQLARTGPLLDRDAQTHVDVAALGRLGLCDRFKADLSQVDHWACTRHQKAQPLAHVARLGRCRNWPGLSDAQRTQCEAGDFSGDVQTSGVTAGQSAAGHKNLVEKARMGECDALSGNERHLCTIHYERIYGGAYPGRPGVQPRFVVRDAQIPKGFGGSNTRSLESIARARQCDKYNATENSGFRYFDVPRAEELYRTCKQLEQAAGEKA